jgi:hypothetical protein
MKYIILGNSLGTMAAAYLLAEKNQQVTLINPFNQWGAYFDGYHKDGFDFDNGTVLYELSSFTSDPNTDVRSYNPKIRYDVGRFVHHAGEFFNKIGIELVTMPDLQMWINGQFTTDVLMTNRFDGLKHLTDTQKKTAKQELEKLLSDKRGKYHASNKYKDPEFINYDYQTASLANHGQTFHDFFIEGFIRKVFNRKSAEMSAVYHRFAWLPLYWPETLHSQFTDKPQVLKPDTYCSYPKAGSAFSMIKSLREKIERHKNITVVTQGVKAIGNGNGLPVELKDGTKLSADKFVWALSHEGLLQLGGMPAEPVNMFSQIRLCQMAVRTKNLRKNFGPVFIPDEKLIFYRMTNQTACARRSDEFSLMSVEFNRDYANAHGLKDHPQTAAYVRKSLTELGVIGNPEDIELMEIREIDKGRYVPLISNQQLFDKRLAMIEDRYPGVSLLGAPSGICNSAMNDQIVQSLKLAAEA